MPKSNTAESTDLVDYEAYLAAKAAGFKERLAKPTSPKIRLGGKRFELPNGETHPGPLSVIILEFAYLNRYYKNPYNKNDIVPPDCIAVSLNSDDLAPADTVPSKQAENCAVCPHNQWGSGSGRGKACGNGARLAVVQPDADADSEILLLEVTKTAIKRWNNYADLVAARYKTPVMGNLTEVSFDPNQDYPSLVFRDLGRAPPNPAFIELAERCAQLLLKEQD